MFAERIASWFRAYVIAVSQSDYDAAIAQRIISPTKLITILNGIDEHLAEQLLESTPAREQLSAWAGVDLKNTRVAVAIANLYPAKNIPLLIQAFDFVVRRISDARLVIIGDGQQRGECEKILKNVPDLAKKVFLVGKHPDAYKILRGADVMCLASTKEGMPYAVLEAQLAGTPVVATRVGGVPEMGEEPLLRLVVPHSAEMLADAIAQTLRENKRGSGILQKKFTLSGMVNAIEAVYQNATFQKISK